MQENRIRKQDKDIVDYETKIYIKNEVARHEGMSHFLPKHYAHETCVSNDRQW